jgi:hypothetical protein
MSQDQLVIIGVRHHSPACARRVGHVIESVKPAFVLIEGPSDFNPYIDDLRGDHALPIAIFSFCSGAERMSASYTPFCGYSPEWRALAAAWATGAAPLFCDLPAWSPAFGDRANRYADPHKLYARYRAAGAALARGLGAEGQDATWDALAEQAEDAILPAILDAYFEGLRPEGSRDPSEAEREACMAGYAAWALREAAGRPVVLVCGGWHVAGVRDAVRTADGTKPAACEPPEGARTGSYLVPYSYARLDRFTGYSAGMPSPAYYEALHAGGLDAAADWAMQCVGKALRAAGQPVSTADQIAWRGHAEALARLRGHRAILRADILDSALAVLIKDALEIPAAWAEDGTIAGGSDPFVAAMLRALSGDLEGKLAPDARQPPLVADVEARMRNEDITPTRFPRRVLIDWHDPSTRNRAHILHQLRILAAPGIVHLTGAKSADARDLSETFEVAVHRDWFGALAEASLWGGSLPMAASARLSASVVGRQGDLQHLASALSDSLFAGLLGLGQDLLERLTGSVSTCRDVAQIGRAGRQIARLYRFGAPFGAAAHTVLGGLGETIFEQALWLIQGVTSEEEGTRAIDAVLACRELARDSDGLSLDRRGAVDVFLRCVAADETPPGLAGAALGYLTSCGDEGASSDVVTARIRRFGQPDSLGDFLTGLFALAREELRGAEGVLAAIDAVVAEWSTEEFLKAAPAMRLAFSWFPPLEREALARTILQRYGLSPVGAEAGALAWMRQKTAILDQAAAMALEERTGKRLIRHGFA